MAYAMWNEAWQTSRDLESPIGVRLADEAFAGLTRLLILMGRKEDSLLCWPPWNPASSRPRLMS